MTTARLDAHVLLVDDDVHLCRLLATDLAEQGCTVTWCGSAAEAFPLIEGHDIDVVLADIEMGAMSGLDLCERIVHEHANIPVIILTAHNNVERAVGAIRAGAFDFIAKPPDLDLLGVAIERAVRTRRLREEVTRLRQAVANAQGFGALLYGSPVMHALADLMTRVAPSDASVLITGESGTGKELVARALHDSGPRGRGPFVAINCAAVPENLLESELFGHVRGAFTDAHAQRTGLFVQANGGTLFLDEMSDLSLALQPKLLRVLQDHSVRPVGSDRQVACDVRIIAATNQDLEAAVTQGLFREDLYFRVNVIHLEVPPLRARGTDVLLLAQTFLERYATKASKPIHGIDPAAAEHLLAYRWPGNVRELQNCMERAVALAVHDHVGVQDLPEKIRRQQAAHDVPAVASTALVPLDEVERRHILQVLDTAKGNRTLAARALGLDRKTLYRKLQRYNLAG